MIWAVLLVGAEASGAFLTLDLIFRSMSMQERGLRARVRRLGWLYGTVGALGVAIGAWGQGRLGGAPGAMLAALDWAPWWLLWRFGLRKQLGFLFQSD